MVIGVDARARQLTTRITERMNNEHCNKCSVSYDSDYQSCGCNPASVDPIVMRRTPFEIAEAWYNEEVIAKAIQDSGSNGFGSWGKIPENVYSPEFAKWLVYQYRLAMAKGIQLGRDCSEDKPSS